MTIKQAIEELDQTNPIQLLKETGNLFKQTKEYRQECKQFLDGKIGEHSTKLSHLEHERNKAAMKVDDLKYKETMLQLTSMKQDLIDQMEGKRQSMTTKELKRQSMLDEIEKVRESLEDGPSADLLALRLKLYKGMGFDWAGQNVDRMRVKSVRGDDVQTVIVSGDYPKAKLANQLWDIASN